MWTTRKVMTHGQLDKGNVPIYQLSQVSRWCVDKFGPKIATVCCIFTFRVQVCSVSISDFVFASPITSFGYYDTNRIIKKKWGERDYEALPPYVEKFGYMDATYVLSICRLLLVWVWDIKGYL